MDESLRLVSGLPRETEGEALLVEALGALRESILILADCPITSLQRAMVLAIRLLCCCCRFLATTI